MGLVDAASKFSKGIGWLKTHPVIVTIGVLLTVFGAIEEVRDWAFWLIENLELIIQAPDNLWLRWSFIITGLGILIWGALRAGASEEKLFETRLSP